MQSIVMVKIVDNLVSIDYGMQQEIYESGWS